MNASQLHSLLTPDYSHVTGLLQHLNSDELKELLHSDEKREIMIKDLQQVKDIEAEREMIMTSNKSLSEFNFSKKDIIENNRSQCEETLKIATDLKTSLCDMKEKIEKNKSQNSQDTLLALLQAATAEAEEKAEATVEFFLNNELSADDFVKQYLEERKLVHLRRTKSEKMITLMQEAGNLRGTPPSRPQRLRKPPAPPAPNRNIPQVPYPYGNFVLQNSNPIVPARQAPRPPVAAVHSGMPYQNHPTYIQNQIPPNRFTYCLPYPPQPYGVPQTVPRFN